MVGKGKRRVGARGCLGEANVKREARMHARESRPACPSHPRPTDIDIVLPIIPLLPADSLSVAAAHSLLTHALAAQHHIAHFALLSPFPPHPLRTVSQLILIDPARRPPPIPFHPHTTTTTAARAAPTPPR